MRFSAEPVRSPSVFRLAVCASLAMATAGCSGDTNRFDQPFSNPFASQPQPEASNAEPAQRPNYVESRPLPQAGQPQYGQPQYSQPPAPQYQQAPRQDVTGSVQPVVARAPQQQWAANGGTPITVAQGETIQSISHRYGVPALAIAEANGMSTKTPVYPGQRLVIPKYTYGQAAAVPPPPAPSMRREPQLASAPILTGSVRNAPQAGMHVVNPGETLFSVARRYNVSPVALAQANGLPPHHQVRMGERLKIPGAAGSRIAQQAPRPAPVAAAAPQRVAQAPVAAPPAPAPVRVAEFQPAPPPAARLITPAKDNPVAEEAKPAPAESSASNSPGFRWPARGRVITGFGPKPTGQQNDGINLAVPEGTPIKASDDGVVAYAGNELKGYGNLVLVRHSNGYVTAYAHASELMVKRGDSVKRGQTIAKSGQTGTVTSPQLHFEIRKGATPVDPMQFLQGAT